MRKFRLVMSIMALIFIAIGIAMIDYNDLSWSNNSGEYLGIFSASGIIFLMVLSHRYEKKNIN